MPCANGTSILMKFDNIVNAVSYICELAHALSARLFHWTFCHAVPDAQCECRITVPQMGVLLEEDIMKLYSGLLPLLSQQNKKQNKRKYYASYKKRVRQSETPEQTAQRQEYDKLHKQASTAKQTPEQNKQRREYNKVKKQASRGKEIPEKQKQRQQYDKAQKHASRINETPQKRSKD